MIIIIRIRGEIRKIFEVLVVRAHGPNFRADEGPAKKTAIFDITTLVIKHKSSWPLISYVS